MARSTQTNEVGRLATLLPAFASVRAERAGGAHRGGRECRAQPVPGQVGLCLVDSEGVVELGPAPHLSCDVSGPAPLPTALPEVAWRGGVDLNPLDVTDPEAMRWLETLVWPEEDDRRVRLRHAIDVAAADPPRLVRGDLLTELPALVAEASAYGTVLVFHSAVAAYLPVEQRAELQLLMRDLVAEGSCHWISNEAPERAAGRHRDGAGGGAARRHFVLGVDGRMVGRTHGHGQYLEWLA